LNDEISADTAHFKLRALRKLIDFNGKVPRFTLTAISTADQQAAVVHLWDMQPTIEQQGTRSSSRHATNDRTAASLLGLKL
jgi:hypothetical protein